MVGPLGLETPPNRAFARFFLALYSGVTNYFLGFGFSGGITRGVGFIIISFFGLEFPLSKATGCLNK